MFKEVAALRVARGRWRLRRAGHGLGGHRHRARRRRLRQHRRADWQLQREGFSTALRDPANVPLDGSVAITVVQFSSGTQVEVPRTVIDSKEKLDGVVAKIESMEQRQGGTDPDNGITAGVEALKPFREDTKTVLCLSSDGTGNEPRPGHSVAGAPRPAGIERFSVIGIDDYGNTGRAAQLLRPARLRRRRDDDRPQHGRVRVADRGLLLRRRRHAARARGQPGRAGLAQLQDRCSSCARPSSAPSSRPRPGAPDQRVTGRLIGRRDGVELPGSPLVATNASGNVLARNDIVARRGEIDDSLNFELPLAGPAAASSSSSTPAARRWTARSPPTRARRPTTAASTRRLTPRRRSASRSSASRSTAPGRAGTTSPSRPRACSSALPVSALEHVVAHARLRARVPRSTISTTTCTGMREVERTSCSDGCAASPATSTTGCSTAPPSAGSTARPTASRATPRPRSPTGSTAPTSSGYARNTVVHELSHTLGVHHAVDNSLGISGGFLWWGGNKTGHCGEVASKDAPGHTPFISVDGRHASRPRPDRERRRRGLGRRPPLRARRRERPRPLRPAKRSWALMGYCSDGDGQFRWPSAFERDQQIDGHPRSPRRAAAAEAAAAGRPARSTPRPTSSCRRPGSRGVLISGTVNATDKSATITSALPLPYSGRRRARRGHVHAAGRGRRRRRCSPSGASRRRALRRRRGRRSDRVVRRDRRDPGRPPRSARSRSSATATAPLGTRSAATGAAPTVGDVAISDPRIDAAPVTLTWKRSAGSISAMFFSPDDGVSWRPLAFRLSGESFVIKPRDARRPRPPAASRSRPPTACAARSRSSPASRSRVANAAPTIEITSPRPDDPSPSGLQPIIFSALAGDRDQALPADAVVWRSDRDGELGRGATFTRRRRPAQRRQAHDHRHGHRRPGRVRVRDRDVEVFRVAPPPPSADKTVTAHRPTRGRARRRRDHGGRPGRERRPVDLPPRAADGVASRRARRRACRPIRAPGRATSRAVSSCASAPR